MFKFDKVIRREESSKKPLLTTTWQQNQNTKQNNNNHKNNKDEFKKNLHRTHNSLESFSPPTRAFKSEIFISAVICPVRSPTLLKGKLTDTLNSASFWRIIFLYITHILNCLDTKNSHRVNESVNVNPAVCSHANLNQNMGRHCVHVGDMLDTVKCV